MNYEINYIDYIQSGINETEAEADEVTIFKKFSSAKKELIRLTKSDRDQITERIKELKCGTKISFGVK